MKKILTVIIAITFVLIMSGCSNKSDKLGFNQKYECIVYNYNDTEEHFDNVKSWELVDNMWNNTKDGVYIELYNGDKFYYLGYKYNVICKQSKMID